MRTFVNNFLQPYKLELEQYEGPLNLPDGVYRLTLADSATAATRWEIIDADVEDGTAIFDRARENTTQQDWPAGSVIYCAMTAGTANELSSLVEQGGIKGDPGNSVELRSTATHIQWREVGTAAWIDLVSLESLAMLTASIIAPRLLPAGGKKEQALVKRSNVDYDIGWADRVVPPAPPILAVALYYGTVLVDTASWEIIEPATPITGAMTPAFIRDGAALVASGSGTPRLAAYAAPEWSRIAGLSPPSQSVSQIEVSAPGDFIAVGLQASPHLRIYRLSDFSDVALGQPVPSFFSMMAVSPTGDHVALAINNSQEVILYRTSDWTRVPLGAASIGQVVETGGGLSFTPDGSELVLMTFTAPQILRFRVSDGALLTGPAAQPSGTGRSLALSQQYAAATSTGGARLFVYNLATWSLIGGTPTVAGNPVHAIFSPDGRWLVVCNTASPWMTVIDTSDWRVVSLPSPPASATRQPAFSQDGKLLAVALGSAPYIQIFNTSDWTPISTSLGLYGSPNGMAFSP